jgi:hypothetical protein
MLLQKMNPKQVTPLGAREFCTNLGLSEPSGWGVGGMGGRSARPIEKNKAPKCHPRNACGRKGVASLTFN